tara:strand:- start:708 stop:917 length:210 start_codon:yes stop_codon:yes gene_type:complete
MSSFFQSKKYLAAYLKILLGVVSISLIVDFFYFDFNFTQSIENNISTLHFKVIAALVVSIFYFYKKRNE